LERSGKFVRVQGCCPPQGVLLAIKMILDNLLLDEQMNLLTIIQSRYWMAQEVAMYEYSARIEFYLTQSQNHQKKKFWQFQLCWGHKTCIANMRCQQNQVLMF